MTKKHFQAVARGIAHSATTKLEQAVIARQIAHELESVCPLFNREKFLAACGVE